jgi:glutaconate CoA-transferase subunit B
MNHQKRRFVPQVDYVTSPGYGDGAGWRQKVGLPRGGPAAVITTLGVLQFDSQSREMMLVEVHPGVSIEDIQKNTGWPLQVAPNLTQTKIPSKEELKMIKHFDPQGYWTGT